MNFDLSDEQKQLADGVARFGRERSDFNAWRARVAASHGFDRGNWSAMAGLGWQMLAVSEADGGLGGSAVDTMVVMEGIGRSLMLEPYVGTAVVAPALLPHLPEPRRSALAAAIIGGEAVVSLADAEPGGRFTLSHVETRAEPRGDNFVLRGEKSHALDGGEAGWFILTARTSGAAGDEDGITLFLVPADAPGLTVHVSRAIDHRRNASLTLAEVAVPADAVIGPLDGGFPLLEGVVERAIVARLAEALGVMEAAHQQTLDYLRTRRQFGQPLASFQALQHRAVDMAIACEEARSMTYLATLSLDAEPAERRRVISAAKARVGQTSLYVGRQAVQLHGGMGFSDELAISHYLKRLIMLDMAFGNAAEHRRRLAV